MFFFSTEHLFGLVLVQTVHKIRVVLIFTPRSGPAVQTVTVFTPQYSSVSLTETIIAACASRVAAPQIWNNLPITI